MNWPPPEIISRIARFTIGEDAVDAGSMIPLTHICRYWRDSIVSTPRNWTLISGRRVRLAGLSLKRCQAAPLELWLSMRLVDPRLTALITPYIQNTEALFVHNISTIRELAQVLPDFPRSMPNLQALELASDPVLAHHVEREFVSAEPLGQPTFTLTHLSLSFVPLYPSLQRLTTLTNLTLRNYMIDLHIDTLLDFLEANRALEHVDLGFRFTRLPFRDSRHQVGIVNRLRSLSICFGCVAGGNALISRIPLQKGARLEIRSQDWNAGLSEVLCGISVTHFSNLQSPTSMEYRPDDGTIQLLGPNGSFIFHGNPHFSKLPLFQHTGIKGFRLVRRPLRPRDFQTRTTFPPLTLQALETLAVEGEVAIPYLLSALFADPSAFPSLKTLVFFDCRLDEACMKTLTKFVSDRKNTTSARLYRVVVISPGRNLPSVSSIDTLREHVPVVDVRTGKKLPADLF